MKKNWKILVLNKNYEPIKITDIMDGITKVYAEKAYFLDKNFQRYTFEEWVEYSKKHKFEEEKINTVHFFFLRPYVILMKVYARYRIPRLNRENLIIRDKGICQYCGMDLYKKKKTIDHVIPKSRGGKLKWDNVVLSCSRCNNKKDNHLVEECGMKLLSKPKIPELVDLFLNIYSDKDLKFLDSFRR